MRSAVSPVAERRNCQTPSRAEKASRSVVRRRPACAAEATTSVTHARSGALNRLRSSAGTASSSSADGGSVITRATHRSPSGIGGPPPLELQAGIRVLTALSTSRSNSWRQRTRPPYISHSAASVALTAITRREAVRHAQMRHSIVATGCLSAAGLERSSTRNWIGSPIRQCSGGVQWTGGSASREANPAAGAVGWDGGLGGPLVSARTAAATVRVTAGLSRGTRGCSDSFPARHNATCRPVPPTGHEHTAGRNRALEIRDLNSVEASAFDLEVPGEFR